MVAEIKEIINRQLGNLQLGDVMVATVVAISPLEIQISHKLIVGEANLVLARALTDYTISMTVDHATKELEYAINTKHSHGILRRNTMDTVVQGIDGSYKSILTEAHYHELPETSTKEGGENIKINHSHEYVGQKSFLVHGALELGEKVIVLRKLGGQQYFVIDRLGE